MNQEIKYVMMPFERALKRPEEIVVDAVDTSSARDLERLSNEVDKIIGHHLISLGSPANFPVINLERYKRRVLESVIKSDYYWNQHSVEILGLVNPHPETGQNLESIVQNIKFPSWNELVLDYREHEYTEGKPMIRITTDLSHSYARQLRDHLKQNEESKKFLLAAVLRTNDSNVLGHRGGEVFPDTYMQIPAGQVKFFLGGENHFMDSLREEMSEEVGDYWMPLKTSAEIIGAVYDLRENSFYLVPRINLDITFKRLAGIWSEIAQLEHKALLSIPNDLEGFLYWAQRNIYDVSKENPSDTMSTTAPNMNTALPQCVAIQLLHYAQMNPEKFQEQFGRASLPYSYELVWK